MSAPLLQVENLVKDYGGFRAVDRVSFEIPRGRIIGLLGPNGAGKTTTIHMLLGITTPTSGRIVYFGQDFAANRQAALQRINFASSYNTLQGRITVWQNLVVFGHLYGLRRPDDKIRKWAEYFAVTPLINKRYWDLSTGQRTRVNLIKALLNDPELILMDEPTAALDPDIADKTLTLIEEIRRDAGVSILYTSHRMNEVTRICDEVIFLDRGRIFAQDTPLGLTKRIRSATLRLTIEGDRGTVAAFLGERAQPFDFTQDHTVVISTTEQQIPDLIFGLSERGVWITDIEVEKPTLEDVFLKIARGDADV
ncbi:MAG TPA: ABC transporter ATP-binding protein [bacterium]|nr:ABC transporter ATP-binding protein [bacterium]